MPVQKVRFHTDISDLMHFMENLPYTFRNEGTTIKNDRNEIKIINFGGVDLCVKAFNKVTVFNRFMYSWFRPSKAERSYNLAKFLLKKGIDTPYPLGYVEVKGRWGILKTSFYVSLCQQYNFMLSDIIKGEHPEAKEILGGFARFMATKVHPAGIWHGDLSTGNVLINKNSLKNYSFSMVDLNRIKVKKRISPRTGIRNLQKLTNRPVYLSIMAEEYAMASKNDPAMFAYSLIGSHIATSLTRRHVKRFLRIFKPKKAMV
ncbi:lipopolysaccharide kinase InaA family protein [Anaerophaga thermohalophila]|jgi:hypothetical protein|uniref:lipopolysaccharide kinase InaA family protein n=1 Tax=Anaerophaga thermohalophila TaxID=177400 RepID=UPI00031B7A7D|nr:lipopolysaccharide kinase InaA family protein [Anaerophaga thermohalophila]